MGDLGNVEAGFDGHANFEHEFNEIMLYGEFSVIGRSCICHNDEDDLGLGKNEESLRTGNAGARLSCGVIGISGPF